MRFKLILVFLVVAVTLIGCSSSKCDDIVVGIDPKKINQKAKQFFDRYHESNGAYLYSTGSGEQTFMIHYPVVQQGEAAQYIKSVTPQITDKTLTFLCEVMDTYDYNDTQLGEVKFFQIKNSNQFDKVLVKVNGENTPINVSGN